MGSRKRPRLEENYLNGDDTSPEPSSATTLTKRFGSVSLDPVQLSEELKVLRRNTCTRPEQRGNVHFRQDVATAVGRLYPGVAGSLWSNSQRMGDDAISLQGSQGVFDQLLRQASDASNKQTRILDCAKGYIAALKRPPRESGKHHQERANNRHNERLYEPRMENQDHFQSPRIEHEDSPLTDEGSRRFRDPSSDRYRTGVDQSKYRRNHMEQRHRFPSSGQRDDGNALDQVRYFANEDAYIPEIGDETRLGFSDAEMSALDNDEVPRSRRLKVRESANQDEASDDIDAEDSLGSRTRAVRNALRKPAEGVLDQSAEDPYPGRTSGSIRDNEEEASRANEPPANSRSIQTALVGAANVRKPRSQPGSTDGLSTLPFQVRDASGRSWRSPDGIDSAVADLFNEHMLDLVKGNRRPHFLRLIQRTDQLPLDYCMQCDLIKHKRGDCTFSSRLQACDQCVRAKRPCAKLVRIDDEMYVGWLPVPDRDAEWQEWSFWVP